ncbi:MAG: hypothetical protein CMJ65_15075 [Planctomycetaceae bacterium]|nr:hypothetical protein [Planctomycetaceae bacterium]
MRCQPGNPNGPNLQPLLRLPLHFRRGGGPHHHLTVDLGQPLDPLLIGCTSRQKLGHFLVRRVQFLALLVGPFRQRTHTTVPSHDRDRHNDDEQDPEFVSQDRSQLVHDRPRHATR